jgi:hypothetical protein
MCNEENFVKAIDLNNWLATMEVKITGDKDNREITCDSTDVLEGLKNVRLEWEIVTGEEVEGEWEIIGVQGLPNNVFTEKAKDGYDYKCKDKNRIMMDYKYTIIVGCTTTAEVLVLDPTIRNGGLK